MTKIIIGGSRNFQNYKFLKEKLDKLLPLFEDEIEIVSGGAVGAARLGEIYAKRNKIPIKQFIPNWDLYGKFAGFRRNVEMAHYADACICFWDGSSKGTKHMIEVAKKEGLKLYIFRI